MLASKPLDDFFRDGALLRSQCDKCIKEFSTVMSGSDRPIRVIIPLQSVINSIDMQETPHSESPDHFNFWTAVRVYIRTLCRDDVYIKKCLCDLPIFLKLPYYYYVKNIDILPKAHNLNLLKSK